MARYHDEIACGELRVLFMDECHLMAGDLEGYVWGTRGKRVEVPIVNERERQTYYGALDLLSKQVLIEAHSAGNTANTLAYLKFLKAQFPQQRLLLLWDGASYHRAHEIRDFLAEVNDQLAEEQWPIHCIQFAPNDHLVLVTKYRYPVLTGDLQKRCRELIIQLCDSEDVKIVKGVVSKDHVHMLIECPPSKSISELVKLMKGRTSRLLQQEYPALKRRYWENTFGDWIWSLEYGEYE